MIEDGLVPPTEDELPDNIGRPSISYLAA